MKRIAVVLAVVAVAVTGCATGVNKPVASKNAAETSLVSVVPVTNAVATVRTTSVGKVSAYVSANKGKSIAAAGGAVMALIAAASVVVVRRSRMGRGKSGK